MSEIDHMVFEQWIWNQHNFGVHAIQNIRATIVAQSQQQAVKN